MTNLERINNIEKKLNEAEAEITRLEEKMHEFTERLNKLEKSWRGLK